MGELDLRPMGHMQVESVVNGPVETNTYFVISEGEALVIDPAWDGERLARTFLDAHPDVRVTGIVCTHAHADHTGGVAGMRRVLGDAVPYIVSEVDAAYLARAVDAMRGLWGIESEVPPAPDRTVREGDRIRVGDVSFQVIETPGHTPGGIVLFAATEDGDIAFVGDTLFPGGCGRTDLEGGDDAAIMRSIAKLGAILPVDTRCCIGHGPSTTIARELEVNPLMGQVRRSDGR